MKTWKDPGNEKEYLDKQINTNKVQINRMLFEY